MNKSIVNEYESIIACVKEHHMRKIIKQLPHVCAVMQQSCIIVYFVLFSIAKKKIKVLRYNGMNFPVETQETFFYLQNNKFC